MRPIPSSVLRGALTAAVAAGLVATATTVPAHAATGYDHCPWGDLCLFSDPLGKGQTLVVKGSVLNLGAWDNRVSSFANYPDWPVCFSLAAARMGPAPPVLAGAAGPTGGLVLGAMPRPARRVLRRGRQ